MATKTEQVQINVEKIERATFPVAVIGTTPILLNRLQEKARRVLLLGGEPKTAASRAANLKHNPPEEFRGSPYLLSNNDAPTYLAFLASAFRQAIASAALDIPGARKAQVGRLVWVEGDTPTGRIALWGLPALHMDVVRSADIARTPDIRTRCCVARWAIPIRVSYAPSLIREQAVLNLLAAGGEMVGVGDGRNEKGKLRYGCFRIANEDDPELEQIMEEGGRTAQIAAMKNPIPFDEETEELLDWWRGEVTRRGVKIAEAA